MTEVIDPESLINAALEADLDSSVFELDDGDLQLADNCIDWVLGATFLNSSLFTKQADMLIQLFSDYCKECSDPFYLNNIPVEGTEGMGEFRDRVTLLVHGVCPQCKKNRAELFSDNQDKDRIIQIPNEFIGVWGQRSGKSTVTAGHISTYQLHRFLKIPNVARYYEQMVGTQFDMAFVALTATQAESTLWSKFIGAYRACPWFNDYNRWLTEQAVQLKIKPDLLFKVKDTFLWYGGSKNINATFKPAHAGRLRGDTRILTAIDELGWMDSSPGKVIANGEETYASLNNSLRTIRSMARNKWRKGDIHAPTGLMCNISSPCSVWDPIMRLLKQSQNDPTKVCSHAATWEINPQIKRIDLRSEEMKNPVGFMRDFGASPPLGATPFLGTEKNLERISNAARRQICEVKPIYIDDKAGTGKYIGAQIEEGTLTQDKHVPRIICVDAGETQNSFGVCVCHLEEQEDNTPLLVSDLVVEVMPETIKSSGETIPVHFPTMEKLILKLVDRLSIKFVVWDRWQSTGEIQRLRDLEIKAERYSPKFDDFVSLRSRIFAGNLQAPAAEMENLSTMDITNKKMVREHPWTHFYIQLATVREVGKKVIKPQGGEDDMFRCLVLAHTYLSRPENQEAFLQRGLNAGKGADKTRPSQDIGVTLRKGGGSFGGGSSIEGVGLITTRKRRS